MRQVYRHISFVLEDDTPTTYVIVNRKSGDPLGAVAWYGPWRKWAVTFMDDAVFDETCLADIQDFLRQLKAAGVAGGGMKP